MTVQSLMIIVLATTNFITKRCQILSLMLTVDLITKAHLISCITLNKLLVKLLALSSARND